MIDPDFTIKRLEDQIAWYDRRSKAFQRAFKALKISSIGLAVLIPVLQTLAPPTWIVAAIGGAIALSEGLQQLGQYQYNWIMYRSTCESLKHEKYLYLAKASPYNGEDPHALLAVRVEETVSQEHAKWVATREEKKR